MPALVSSFPTWWSTTIAAMALRYCYPRWRRFYETRGKRDPQSLLLPHSPRVLSTLRPRRQQQARRRPTHRSSCRNPLPSRKNLRLSKRHRPLLPPSWFKRPPLLLRLPLPKWLSHSRRIPHPIPKPQSTAPSQWRKSPASHPRDHSQTIVHPASPQSPPASSRC